MSDVLVRIKRAVLSGRFAFSRKAAEEMDADNLTRLDVVESIVNAVAIYKTIRSRSPFRGRRRQRLYVIQSTNLKGVPIYTKGKLVVLLQSELENRLVWVTPMRGPRQGGFHAEDKAKFHRGGEGGHSAGAFDRAGADLGGL